MGLVRLTLLCFTARVSKEPFATVLLLALSHRPSILLSTWTRMVPQLFSYIMLMIPILPDPRAMSWSDSFSTFLPVSECRELKSPTLIVDNFLCSIIFFFLNSLNSGIRCHSINGHHDILWEWLSYADSFYCFLFCL